MKQGFLRIPLDLVPLPARVAAAGAGEPGAEDRLTGMADHLVRIVRRRGRLLCRLRRAIGRRRRLLSDRRRNHQRADCRRDIRDFQQFLSSRFLFTGRRVASDVAADAPCRADTRTETSLGESTSHQKTIPQIWQPFSEPNRWSGWWTSVPSAGDRACPANPS